jgi:eukaryotic-like serine/threonine-protein kinase
VVVQDTFWKTAAMTPERWRRITEVFHRLRACDVVARAVLLAEACAGDHALRADVEEMLAADAGVGQFGATPVLGAAGSPRLEQGTPFGPYRIDTLIGAGGMGEVYRAHDARLDRDVAIKVLSATTFRDADARLRLLREARSAAALNHPHVCTIFEVGEVDGHAYIAMELIEGNPLDQRILAASFGVEDLLRYSIQIAEGIVHAHDRGIVHRDLKPANVMISTSGIAKVLDFGLAKVLPVADQVGLEFSANHIAASLVMGTAAYMSPEQALGRFTDERSDIFSFGALLYEMATGKPAFTGATSVDVLECVVHATPQPPGSLRGELPAELSHLIEKAISKNPKQRYQRMREVARDLSTINGLLTRGSPSVSGGILARLKPSQKASATAATAVVAAIIWAANPAFREGPHSAPAAVRLDDATAGRTRVAVLPFENLGHREDDDWLASAFSDSLTFGLDSLDSLILVSRESIGRTYRENGLREGHHLEPETIAKLARTLGIRYYVHGTYERVGDQIRVGARLVLTESGAIKTDENVTDRLDNLLEIHDALARTFAATLGSGAIPARRRINTNSLKAHRAITEARGLYAATQWQAALEASKRAVDLDPEYAEAWALLGKSYARVAAPSNFVGGPLQEYRSLARTAAKRAIELDPSSYEAHVALALAHRESAEYEPWRAAAQRAVALNPRSAEAYALLGDSNSETPAWGCPPDGDLALAIWSYRRAVQIDPSVYTYYSNLSENTLKAIGPEAALLVADENLRLHPTNRAGKRSRVLPLIELGRLDEADRMMREAIDDRGPLVQDHRDLGIIDLQRGRFDVAASRFEKAIAQRGHSWRPAIARQYIRAGLIAPALHHLEETLRSEPACAQWLLTTKSPYWAVIRSNSEASTLLEKYRQR